MSDRFLHAIRLFPLLSAGLLDAAQSGGFDFQAMERGEGLRLVGAATIEGSAARLTRLEKNQSGALWMRERQRISPSFENGFTFRLTRARRRFVDGSDGFAFVIRNSSPDAMGGSGSAGGFGLGRGGNPPRPGIGRSLAVFFDTHRNASEGDPSGNSIGLFTNGDGYFPPRRLAIRNQAPVRLNDGRPHRVQIRYDRPRLEVLLDGVKVLDADVELESVAGAGRMAYLGFTASTGEGYQEHDILSWRFTPSWNGARSRVNFGEGPGHREMVESRIQFGPPCIPGRTLCTPDHPEVRMLAPERWRVVLPAHRPWLAAIPNPGGRTVAIRNQQGTIRWKSGGQLEFLGIGTARRCSLLTWMAIFRQVRDSFPLRYGC